MENYLKEKMNIQISKDNALRLRTIKNQLRLGSTYDDAIDELFKRAAIQQELLD